MTAGKLRPAEWQPRTVPEWAGCVRSALEILGQVAQDPAHRREAIILLSKVGRRLLASGFIGELIAIVERITLAEVERVALLRCVEEFLDYDCDEAEADRPSRDTVERALAWRDSLRPTELGARVASFLGATSLKRQLDHEADWLAEGRDLARRLFEDRSVLLERLPWFGRYELGGGDLFGLGQEIGHLDAGGELLADLGLAARTATNPLFFRGYLVGSLERNPHLVERVQALLTSLEDTVPALALDFSFVVPDETGAARRAIRLVREGRLPKDALRDLWRARSEPALVAEGVRLLLDSVGEERRRNVTRAVELLSHWKDALEEPVVREAAWAAIEAGVEGLWGDGYWWGKLLDKLASIDPERGVRVACDGLFSDDLTIEEESTPVVSKLFARDPSTAFLVLSAELGDPTRARRFSVGRRRALLDSIPVEAIKDWLARVGKEGARILAPHLGAPHLAADGEEVVPSLTEFVLEKFEDDDETFHLFCSGVHAFQVYCGDFAAEHESEIKLARRFSGHRLRRIREWAAYEVSSAKADAKWARERQEENFDV